ncbi:MAG: ribonuclease D [Cocleimonas sp.]
MFEVIETKKDLIQFVEKISNSSWLALDTEFLREKTYYAKLCLIQIESSEGLRACVDPLSMEDISPLTELLNNPEITKVFHAAHQDLEILLQITGSVPAPVFDTQTAASVLGIGDQMGYARLIESMTGKVLSKTQSRTNWAQRPLKTAQLEYAIDDVRYLAQIYPKMLEQLTSKNRLVWLDKDFNQAVNPDTYAINAQQKWKKVRGLQVLKRPQLAILKLLAAWREEKAESSNLPRKWIIGDEILLELAKLQPSDTQGLSDIRGLNIDRTKKYHTVWLNLIQQGQAVPESEWPELPRSKKPTPNQNITIDLLMLVLQIEAKKHGITPAVIASRKQIAQMIQAGETSLSEDWRGKLVNNVFKKVLSGELKLGLEKNSVSLF